MESQYEYVMYFPAAPITSLTDPADFSSLPRRKYVYLGETIQFLLVLRSRSTARLDDSSCGSPWREQVGSLAAVASVCVAESRQQRPCEDLPDLQSSCSESGGEEEPEKVEKEDTDNRGRRLDSDRTFTQCSPLFIHSSSASDGRQCGREPVKSALVLEEQVVFCLTVSLDKLPVNTLKAKIVVTVWQPEEKVVREHGYLTLLQLQSPTHTFRQDLNMFKTQVLNCSSLEEVCVRDVKILPNYNSSYLPVMPDGSVLIVDNVCHQSAELTMASFYRVDNKSLRLPSMLSALEEQNFLFQLQLQDKAEEDSSEMHLYLLLVAQYPVGPSSAGDDGFLSPHCKACGALQAHGGSQQDPRVGAVVCQSPVNNLGQCRKGSTLSFTIAFQILRTGLFELSQHMKLKLQFTASVSTPPAEPRSRQRNSPSSSSPAVRELLEGHSLGRSHSFSHQQPSRSHHVRSGSVMERRAITPPVGSPVVRALHLPPEPALISLDKIAKRECKVLVLEPIQETHSR
ncbi:hypothetical protein PAMP_015399 [Pampus punctatissimus]